MQWRHGTWSMDFCWIRRKLKHCHWRQITNCRIWQHSWHPSCRLHRWGINSYPCAWHHWSTRSLDIRRPYHQSVVITYKVCIIFVISSIATLHTSLHAQQLPQDWITVTQCCTLSPAKTSHDYIQRVQNSLARVVCAAPVLHLHRPLYCTLLIHWLPVKHRVISIQSRNINLQRTLLHHQPTYLYQLLNILFNSSAIVWCWIAWLSGEAGNIHQNILLPRIRHRSSNNLEQSAQNCQNSDHHSTVHT